MWLSKFYEVSMDELMGVATDDKQPTDEGQQVTSKPVFPKKIAIVLCAIAVFIGVVAWIVFSAYKNREDSEPPVGIGELDSYDVGSLDREDGKLGKE